MAKNTMDVTAFVGKLLSEDEPDVLHDGIRVLTELLMDAEVTAAIGAERYERTESRTAERNGHRTSRWDTRVGTIELRIPRSPPAATSPRCSSRAGAEQALAAVVQEA